MNWTMRRKLEQIDLVRQALREEVGDVPYVPSAWDRHRDLKAEQMALAHEKLRLELELSTVTERMAEIARELTVVEMRLAERESAG